MTPSERVAAWRKENQERHRANMRAWRARNRERVRQYDKEWRERNPDRSRSLDNARGSKYRATRLRATLPGYDEEIRQIYLNCPKGMHVDHEVPLQGRNVCGLHVPWNLQYLTGEQNRKKFNKF